jgi:membrane protein required for colicin V production
MNIATIDIIFTVLIFILILRCALRGFVREVMSMASVVLGLLAALLFYKPGAAFVRTKILEDVKVLPELIAFASLMIIVFIIIKILERIIQDIISRITLLGGIDHSLGLVVGFVEGLLLVSLILFVLSIQPLFDQRPLLENSFFAKLLNPLVGGIRLPVLGVEGGV